MRTVCLIRHGRPDVPLGRRMCLGSTDLPLGAVGRMQGVLLAAFMEERPVTAVFCSGLSRAVQTAGYLTPSPVIIPGLREMDAGEWDGLYFDEIQERWPEVYAKRGEDRSFPIPGGEDREAGRTRFLQAVHQALAQSEGDIAIVAHAGVIHSLTETICPGWERPGYASVTALCHGEDGFKPMAGNQTPRPALTYGLCEKLLAAAGAPERAAAHCRAVADKAAELARAVGAAGAAVDISLASHAALLHDIARGHHDHARLGGQWLRELGYPEVAAIIEDHHDREGGPVDEGAIVYMADKLIWGTKTVTPEERFEASREKCGTPEALAAHERRFRAALELKGEINQICGKEVVT